MLQAQAIPDGTALDVSSRNAVILFHGGSGTGSLARTEKAAALFRDGKAGLILCVGGARPRLNRIGCEDLRDRLIALGVPGDAVTADRESYDSLSNLAAARHLLAGRNIDRLIFVSDPLHLVRLRALAGDMGHPVDLAAAPYADDGFAWLVYRVNHELLAEALRLLLPEAVYRNLMHDWRGR